MVNEVTRNGISSLNIRLIVSIKSFSIIYSLISILIALKDRSKCLIFSFAFWKVIFHFPSTHSVPVADLKNESFVKANKHLCVFTLQTFINQKNEQNDLHLLPVAGTGPGANGWLIAIDFGKRTRIFPRNFERIADIYLRWNVKSPDSDTIRYNMEIYSHGNLILFTQIFWPLISNLLAFCKSSGLCKLPGVNYYW